MLSSLSFVATIRRDFMGNSERDWPHGHLDAHSFSRISALLLQRLEKAQFAGWDPYDALNSRIFNLTPLRHIALARLAWTQAFKRSPLNLRSAVGIPKTANPVTIALAVEIYRRDGSTARARQLLMQLLGMAVPVENAGMIGWGYPFPWQAKAFYVPNNAPNVIATAYAIRELRHWSLRMTEADGAIAGAASLLATKFVRQSPEGQRYIAYVQNSDAMVHNANLWGAFVLAHGAQVTGRRDWLDLASDAVAYTMAAQRSDGSWVYGKAEHHQFTDGFHTGYVLEALRGISEAAPSIDTKKSVERGLDYYLNNLFEADGTAKYYCNNRYPIDANPAAQAVITLDALQAGSDFGGKVMEKIIASLWLEEKGYFACQRSARGLNAIEYPRWTQIWLALAMRIAAHQDKSPLRMAAGL
jgi:polysaccharide biosynthesis protein VpsJ